MSADPVAAAAGMALSDDAARKALRLALASPPTLGGSRLVCVDGPAGSGKSTLAGAIARLHPGCVVVHVDDLLEGWSGLAEVGARVRTLVIDPLRSGAPARFRRYDWVAQSPGEPVVVPPAPLVVLEGVGAADPSYDDAVTVLVYVDAPRGVRLARGVARDGEELRQHWLDWQAEEDRLLARHRTRERADRVVTTG